ncbi:MAG: 6-phosphogluconolactonase [Limisphaerales bacterium]
MNDVRTTHAASDGAAAAEAAGSVLDAFVRAGEGDFGLALSGGRAAEVFFGELVRQSRLRGVDLAAADFFWCDERCVPPDHEDSNFRGARRALLEPLGVPEARIHRLEGERDPAAGAERALEDWRDWIRGRRDRGRAPAWDCAVLGVGEDGHVASLFPDNLERDLAATAVFRAVRGPKPPPDRLTAGYRLLWEALTVVVLATGRGKESVVRASLGGAAGTPLAHVLRGRVGRETRVVCGF